MSTIQQVQQTEEIIMYRGHKIDVSKIRDWVSRCKNEDGTPYYSPEEAERQVQREILDQKRVIGQLMGSLTREKYGGYSLRTYQREHQMFPEAFKTKVFDKDAVKIVRKLLRHFGKPEMAKNIKVSFWGNRQSGCSTWNEIRLSHNPSIGLITHEVTHKFRSRHGKKFLKFMKKAINYCSKNKNIKAMCETEEEERVNYVCGRKCGFKTKDMKLAISHFEKTGHPYKRVVKKTLRRKEET